MDQICDEWIKQKKIKIIMAVNNVSFSETLHLNKNNFVNKDYNIIPLRLPLPRNLHKIIPRIWLTFLFALKNPPLMQPPFHLTNILVFPILILKKEIY